MSFHRIKHPTAWSQSLRAIIHLICLQNPFRRQMKNLHAIYTNTDQSQQPIAHFPSREKKNKIWNNNWNCLTNQFEVTYTYKEKHKHTCTHIQSHTHTVCCENLQARNQFSSIYQHYNALAILYHYYKKKHIINIHRLFSILAYFQLLSSYIPLHI